VATRRYEQRQRAEAADQTRRRILDTVIERLRQAPSEPVSIEEIAEKAGVARSTVYAIFGSRASLFDAVAADVLEHAAYERLLDAKHEPDAREHLRAGLRSATEMLAADRDIVRALHSMAQLDDRAVGAAVRRREEERKRGMARLARRLKEQELLRPDVSVTKAGHILWVLTSFESFDLLYTGRGLSAAAVSRLLTETAERALLKEPLPADRPGG
jgi:AcrR family transcriptional regulator